MKKFRLMMVAMALMLGVMSPMFAQPTEEPTPDTLEQETPQPAAPARQGQWVLLARDTHRQVMAGLDVMYNLKYTEADSIFSEIVAKEPNHPAGYFLLALVDWWRIVTNWDDQRAVRRYSPSFEQRLDKTIEVADVLLEKNSADITGLFFKGSALGYKGRLQMMNLNVANLFQLGEAVGNGNEAYKMLMECQRLAPSNSDVLLGSGLFNYFLAYIPEKYPVAGPILSGYGPGDKELGLNMLRISAKRAVYASTEAKYGLLEILLNLQNDNNSRMEAVSIAGELHAKYPGNPVFYKFLAKAQYLVGNYNEADTSWYDILRRIKAREPGYELTLARQGLYYLGDIRLRSGRYTDAVRLFEEADQVSRRLEDDESSWVVLSNLKMGQALDKLNRRAEAIKQYKRVLDMDDFNGAHAKAEEYLAKPFQ